MQAPKTPQHEFRHNVQTQISSKSNESLTGLKCKSTSMEDSFQIFTKALVCFARRDFGSIAFLVAILVSCLLPMCRRWKPLFSLHSNKRIVSISNLLARQTKRQDCILNHHILQALNYKGLEVNPVFHPTCVLRRICILVSASPLGNSEDSSNLSPFPAGIWSQLVYPPPCDWVLQPGPGRADLKMICSYLFVYTPMKSSNMFPKVWS